MKQQSDEETELKRYLLGELTQEERAQVEERLFLNSDYFQQLQAAENDLVDDYVYEELSAADRGRFETYFLSQPGRHEDIKIAQALRRYISTEAQSLSSISTPAVADLPLPPKASKVVFLQLLRNLNSLARVSLATAALIILAISIWLIIRAVRSRDQSPPIQVQRPVPQENVPTRQQDEVITTNSQPGKNPQTEQTEQEQHVEQRNQGAEEIQVANRTKRDARQGREPSSQGTELAGRTLAVLLIPGSSVRGGGEVNKVPLQSDVRFVNLQLPLIGSDKYRDYRVVLQTNQKTILTRSGLKSKVAESGEVVSVMVSAKLLPQTNYQIKLSGVTTEGEIRDIATYAFRVEMR